ncbi:MAG: Glycogen debranching enzyme [bacterium ADurb.Bin212]|nr:MAG: Glycogen debranching enzyme [bacterium ADurb.Bin212]
MRSKFIVEPGSPYPLGATVCKGGVNFSVFSQHATNVELLIFDKNNPQKTIKTLSLNTPHHHTYHFWHALIKGLKPGNLYAFRADGPFEPSNGHRFNKNKVLIDPYSKALNYSLWQKQDAISDQDNLSSSLRSVIIDTGNYNWRGDKPLNRPIEETIIYEMHVGNFTKSPSSDIKNPGKFKGLIEKIPYLKSLGVNAVEIMPVFDFGTGDERNVWGYGTSAFFAVDSRYCISNNKEQHLNEFRDMVRALHKADIEVILDVVFGYTPEGDHNGPTYCFRGLDNSVYYHLSQDDKQYYNNYSGCGNTLNSNHPIVSKFIKDCLEYWVLEMHVDGFRFDEASLLSRDTDGNVLANPTVLWNIDLSEKLAKTKIFAEPWDAGGAYLVGKFPGYRFVEWNGKYRDEMRRFVRGDLGLAPSIAGRMTGSADLYQHTGRLPIHSLNFITAHDGFTLYDLVSYDNKHNEANGEGNRDGIDNNFSCNYGAEGDTDNQDILRFRFRQMKNFLTLLFLSKGIPMITMGDEIARTQNGNNNTYCQDSPISWFNWDNINKNKALLEFFKKIVSFRKKHRYFYDNDTFGKSDKNGWPEIAFHGCQLFSPGWDNSNSRVLSFTLKNKIHIMINMDDQGLMFEIPQIDNKQWYVAINTAEEGIGVYSDGEEIAVSDSKNIYVDNKSIIVMVAK